MSFNLPGGETGFDTQETKLPTYWNTYFSKICLGMKIDEQLRFTVMHLHGDLLYSLIADGRYRQTKLDRVTWKGLIGSQASLQPNCNKEGFNVVSSRSTDHDRARIGFLGNDQNDCSTCDSRIGFGTGDILITRTRVETWHNMEQIMATGASQPWDISWCNSCENDCSTRRNTRSNLELKKHVILLLVTY